MNHIKTPNVFLYQSENMILHNNCDICSFLVILVTITY